MKILSDSLANSFRTEIATAFGKKLDESLAQINELIPLRNEDFKKHAESMRIAYIDARIQLDEVLYKVKF